MQTFSTKNKSRANSDVTFEYDDVTLTARRPKAATILDLAATTTGSDVERVTATMAMVEDSLVPDSRDYIMGRLRDPDDEMDIEDLVPVIEWLVAEFTSRPTPPPPASAGRRSSTGKPSTGRARPRASIPSASAPTGS